LGERASAGRIGNHVFFFFLILVVVGDDAVVCSVSTVDCKAGDVLDDDVLMVMAAELNDWMKDVADDNNNSKCNIIGIIIVTWRRRVILFICCGLVVLFYSGGYILTNLLIVTHREGWFERREDELYVGIHTSFSGNAFDFLDFPFLIGMGKIAILYFGDIWEAKIQKLQNKYKIFVSSFY
jgi:hypothetical protein